MPVEKLRVYRETVLEMFPTIPANLEYRTTLKDADAVALHNLLDRLGSGLAVVEVGTFIGTSSFLLASHPNVGRVYSIDINQWLSEVEQGLPQNVRALDVARRALSRFPEGEKVTIFEGTTQSVQMPSCDVAFVDGAHTREWVWRDLKALYEKSPSALAVLHDCVGLPHEPEVLGGVLDFIHDAPKYRFRLFDRSREPLRSVGLLYPHETETHLEGLLEDPTLSWLQAKVRVSKLRKRTDRLKNRLAALQQ